jgi:hypothetical protein
MVEPYFFGDIVFGAEFLFTTLAVVFCFLIYSRTKESYELTKYEGIKYFRDAFLFLGLSYLVRFLLDLTMISRIPLEFIMPRATFAPLFILPLGYFSTISIFYLIHGSIWKKVNNRSFLVLSHSIAILLSIVSFITRTPTTLLFLQCILLAVVVLLNFVMPHHKIKISQTKVLYTLVSSLWLINLLIIDRMRPFPPVIEIFFQVISLAVFAFIYYKILKWVK